jgi:hypothetical protein
MTNDRPYVPDIGDTFTEIDEGWPIPRGYRVEGWLKRTERGRKVGPDNCPLVFCSREEAEYVSGYGICGVIRRVADVVIDGRVSWSEEHLKGHRRRFALLIGTSVF